MKLHSYAPNALNLPPGTYFWAAWSPSAKGTDALPWHHSAGETFSGWFTVQEKASSATLLEWGRRGNDSRYCLDISDSQGNMLHQAVACGEGLLSYSPQDLNLAGGDYHWKVWSPSVRDYYAGFPQFGFEGEFHVDTCGLPYRSDSQALQWGCRDQDLLYCVDIFDSSGQVLAALWLCGEQMHSFYPEWLKDRNLPAGEYRWKVWSPSVQNYAGAQQGFEGVFSYTPPQPVARPGGTEHWEFYGDRSRIFSLLPTSDGKLWLGTGGGGLELRRQSDGGLEQLVLEGDGALPSGAVTALYRDENGLWAGTFNGLRGNGPMAAGKP